MVAAEMTRRISCPKMRRRPPRHLGGYHVGSWPPKYIVCLSVPLYSGTRHRQIVAPADNEMPMKEPRILKALSLLVLSLLCGSVHAHVGLHPSVHDTVAGIIDRMIHTLNTNELNNL